MSKLSFDISTVSTGWCYTEDNITFILGTIPIDSALSLCEKLFLFSKEVECLLRKYKPTHIVQEDVFAGKNIATTKVLCEFAGLVRFTCYNVLGIENVVVSNKTVKSYFKVKDKQGLFDFVCYLFNLTNLDFKKDNDKVDALAQMIYFIDISMGELICREETTYGYTYLGGNFCEY